MRQHRCAAQRLSIFVVSILVGSFSCASLTTAQPAERTTNPPGEPLLELTPMVITGRADDLLGIAGSASEGRVGQVQLGTRPFLRAGEVLEVIPGVIVTQHSGSGKANQYFLRGFNLDHGTDFSVRVDGVPINFPTHGHGQGYLDLNFLIPELVDYITFRKGPYYAEVGDFSSAGTADMHLVKTLPEGFVKVGVGLDDFYQLTAANSSTLGAGQLLYAFAGQYYNGPWDLSEDTRKFNGLVKYTLEKGGTGFSLTATGYHNEWDATDQIPLRAVSQGIISRLGALDTSDGGRTTRFSLAGNWWHTGENSKTNINAYMVYYRLNLFSNFTFFLDDPVNGDQFEQVDRREVFGGSASHQWFTTWLGKSMDHTLGMQVRYDRIPTVALHKTRERRRLSTVREDNVNETSLAWYYQNQTQWLDKVRTTVGLRSDVFFFDVDSKLVANSGDKVDAIFSPKFTLTLGPWASTELYVNGGFSFHSNDARGTTITVEPVTGEPAARVDPLVRTKGAEVGVRSTWVPGLNSTLAFWYLELDSELLFVGDAGTTEASRPSRRYGVEWANFYKLTSWLTLEADFSFSKAEFTDDDAAGDAIPGAIETAIAAGATVDFPLGMFGSLRLRHFGERPLIEDDSVRSDATTLVNLQVGYKYKRFTAQLDVLNLLDSKDHDIDYFYASRLRGEPDEGIDDLHFHPVEPLTLRLYMTYKF